MRILAIGNGFDIEHDLRTKYSQFLLFVNWMLNGRHSKDDTICHDDKKIYKKLLRKNRDIIKEFNELINENLWITYFISLKLYKEKWVDFEKEISDVIKVIDKGRDHYIDSVMFYTELSKMPPHYKRLADVFNVFDEEICGKDIDELRDKLLVDLRRLARAIEIYLIYWVDNMPINKMNPDVARIHPDKVISFNYTHTFEKVYSRSDFNVEYCYIHGEIRNKLTTKDNNMVLGIDDYVVDGDENGYFIGFKKYYQRLEYSNDANYKEWIEEIKSKPKEKHELFVFGHSLDVTDIEVFKSLLDLENLKTTIYCLDKEKQADLISKVIILIGKTKTIKKIDSGNITFSIQSKSKIIENSELEIHSDCNDLYRISKYNFNEVDQLVNKIAKKIKDRRVEYFYNLSSVISIVDALAYNNLMSIVDETALVDIIETLVINQKWDTFFETDDWVEYSVDGTPNVYPETEKIIATTNTIIKKYLLKNGLSRSSAEQCINFPDMDPSEMTTKQFVEIYNNAFNYCITKNKIDEEASRYLFQLMGENSQVAYGAFKEFKNTSKKSFDKYINYLNIFIKILEKKMSEILYDEYMLEEAAYNQYEESKL